MMASSTSQRTDDINVTFKATDTFNIQLHIEGNPNLIVLISGILCTQDYNYSVVTDSHLIINSILTISNGVAIDIPFNQASLLQLFQEFNENGWINTVNLQLLQKEVTIMKFPISATSSPKNKSKPDEATPQKASPSENKKDTITLDETAKNFPTLFSRKTDASIEITLGPDITTSGLSLKGPKDRMNPIIKRLYLHTSPYVVNVSQKDDAISVCISAIWCQHSTELRPLQGQKDVRAVFNFLGSKLLTVPEVNHLQVVTAEFPSVHDKNAFCRGGPMCPP